jgi:hypothetical protein
MSLCQISGPSRSSQRSVIESPRKRTRYGCDFTAALIAARRASECASLRAAGAASDSVVNGPQRSAVSALTDALHASAASVSISRAILPGTDALPRS